MKNEEKGFHVGLSGIVGITMGLLAGMVVIVTSALVSFWEPDEPAWTWKLTALFLLWAVAVWVKIIYKFKRDKDGRQENNGMLKVLLFSIIAAFVVAAVTMLSIHLPDPVKLGVRIGAFTAWPVLTWANLYAYRRKKT